MILTLTNVFRCAATNITDTETVQDSQSASFRQIVRHQRAGKIVKSNSSYKFDEEHDNDRGCCAPVTETSVTDRYSTAKLPERFQSRGTGCTDVYDKTNNVILSSTSPRYK